MVGGAGGVICVKTMQICHVYVSAYVSKHNSHCESQVILLMVPNREG